MSDPCADLKAQLMTPGWLEDRHAIRTWLENQAEAEACVGRGLQQASQSENWPLFERYVLVAHLRPSPRYTATLCDVLARQSDEVNNEDVVDVLAEIRDPAALGCLEHTMHWQPPWDEFRQLAVKCIWALAAIGTPEALAVLRDAASYEALEIREAAVRQLKIAGNEPY